MNSKGLRELLCYLIFTFTPILSIGFRGSDDIKVTILELLPMEAPAVLNDNFKNPERPGAII